jgi:hypothetical protein
VFESNIETGEVAIRQPFDATAYGVPFGPLFITERNSVDRTKTHRKRRQHKANACQTNVLHLPTFLIDFYKMK